MKPNHFVVNRFKALDIFRGMTIAFMIIVNTTGDWGNTFSLLLHADWHGFTPTDLVFPSFLFAVGNAMAFVSQKWQNKSAKEVLLRGFKRAFLIFLTGYLLYWFPFFKQTDAGWVFKPFATTRVFGVLQRIGLCYAIALPFIYYFSPKNLVKVSAIFLLGYWGLLLLFGDLTLEGNAVLSLDLWLLGPGHLYGGEGIPFDPEGLLSSIPAVVNIFIGFLVGLYVREDGASYEKLTKLLLAGFAMVFVAYIWDPSFPLNKKIWTSSFVLLTSGLDCIIIAAIIYLMEKSPKNMEFKVFDTFGKNPLFIYLLSGLLAKFLLIVKWDGASLYGLIYRNVFEWMGFGSPFGAFMFALSFTTLCWLVAKWLENRNIYIKI